MYFMYFLLKASICCLFRVAPDKIVWEQNQRKFFLEAGDLQVSSSNIATGDGEEKRAEDFETQKVQGKERETKHLLSGNKQNFSKSALVLQWKDLVRAKWWDPKAHTFLAANLLTAAWSKLLQMRGVAQVQMAPWQQVYRTGYRTLDYFLCCFWEVCSPHYS